MKRFLVSVVLLLGTATHPLSDAASDVAYVVDEHIRSEQAEEKLIELSPKTLSDLRPAIENFGAEITDPDRFLDELMGGFHTELLAKRERAGSPRIGSFYRLRKSRIWQIFTEPMRGRLCLQKA